MAAGQDWNSKSILDDPVVRITTIRIIADMSASNLNRTNSG